MAHEVVSSGAKAPIELGNISEVIKTAANLTMMKEVQAVVMEHITSPFNVPTPKEKIKKRPDGYDYIENTWMDKSFKEHSPLYDNELVHYSEASGWIAMIVRVTDRVSGNTELGGASVRIQVRQGVMEPTFRDIIDKGNNITACLSKAIKNAQSRFGHGADVYGKRESAVSEDEKARYETMFKEIKKISKVRAQQFEQTWKDVGVDYSEFLDKWQIFIDRSQKSTAEKTKSATSDVAVTVETSHDSQVSSNGITEKATRFVF